MLNIKTVTYTLDKKYSGILIYNNEGLKRLLDTDGNEVKLSEQDYIELYSYNNLKSTNDLFITLFKE